LGPVAAEAFQYGQLLFGFDAFGHDRQTEGVGQCDDGGDDGALFGAVAQLVDERLVDLDEVERELTQVGQ
jgi:hypothetical protein